MRPRRYLPNISLLLAFDGVMRCGSVTIAAQDLGLTQSTVSRLIQTLEAQLGHPLFLRQRKRLVPTDAARRYFHDISSALDLIQRGGMMVAANPDGGSLDLAILPTFGTRWLAPRLPLFVSAHPGVSVNLTTRIQPSGFQTDRFDAAIFFGEADRPGAGYLKLFDEHLTACAAPDLLSRTPIGTPGDLRRLVLLQLQTRPHAWREWFRGQGADPAPVEGMVVDQFSMMIQMAISGLGVALLPDYIARTEIAEGRLQPVLAQAVPGSGSYWLSWPDHRDSYGPLVAFRSWLEALLGGEGTNP